MSRDHIPDYSLDELEEITGSQEYIAKKKQEQASIDVVELLDKASKKMSIHYLNKSQDIIRRELSKRYKVKRDA